MNVSTNCPEKLVISSKEEPLYETYREPTVAKDLLSTAKKHQNLTIKPKPEKKRKKTFPKPPTFSVEKRTELRTEETARLKDEDTHYDQRTINLTIGSQNS